jgi:N-dimethylarginine dimethylaminohydrolase
VLEGFINDLVLFDKGDDPDFALPFATNGWEICVADSGIAANRAGIGWLQNILAPAYHVREVKIIREFEHLDCVMALFRPGLGLLSAGRHLATSLID